jgi:hypothetical protein
MIQGRERLIWLLGAAAAGAGAFGVVSSIFFAFWLGMVSPPAPVAATGQHYAFLYHGTTLFVRHWERMYATSSLGWVLLAFVGYWLLHGSREPRSQRP